MVASYADTDIDHTSFVLDTVSGGVETTVETVPLTGDPVGKSASFTGLSHGTTYRIYVSAYDVGNTLINTVAASTVDVTVGNDDAPTLASVPIQLADKAFNAVGTSQAIAQLPGAYVPHGLVTTLSGSRTAQFGYAEDMSNDAGTTAQFGNPLGIAVDGAGQVYVADSNNGFIRKVAPNGNTSLLADGGLHPFHLPNQLALDAHGHLYVADSGHNCIQSVDTTTGTATVLAGSGTDGYADDTANDGGATALFSDPQGVAVDTLGNVYVADTGNNCIRKIAPNGDTTTLAGSRLGAVGSSGYANDVANDGGASALFNLPQALAVDAAGNLYVADNFNNGIRKVAPNGDTTTYAGYGPTDPPQGGATDDRTNDHGARARFSRPTGVALDAAGNLYVAQSSCVRVVDPNGNTTTVAGSLSFGYVDDLLADGGTSALFGGLGGVCVSSDGSVYVTDTNNENIRRIQ